MFDSGEEFEDHEKHKNKPNHDNGVYISLDADNVCEVIAEFRKDGNCRHTTPDENTDRKFEKSLPALVAKILRTALPNHKASECKDSNLIEMKRNAHRTCWILSDDVKYHAVQSFYSV